MFWHPIMWFFILTIVDTLRIFLSHTWHNGHIRRNKNADVGKAPGRPSVESSVVAVGVATNSQPPAQQQQQEEEGGHCGGGALVLLRSFSQGNGSPSR